VKSISLPAGVSSDDINKLVDHYYREALVQ
jgi:hypothetical protein